MNRHVAPARPRKLQCSGLADGPQGEVTGAKARLSSSLAWSCLARPLSLLRASRRLHTMTFHFGSGAEPPSHGDAPRERGRFVNWLPSMSTVLCPACGQWVSLPDSVPGREFPCPQCAQPISVPVPTQSLEDDPFAAAASARAQPPPHDGSQHHETIFRLGGVGHSSAGADDLSFLGAPEAPEELGRLDHY